MNKTIMNAVGMGEQVKKVEEGKCPFCGKLVLLNSFRDALSLKEFRISGLCQSCQDDVFAGGEEK